MDNTYSSIHLRERDKILEAKHQAELAAVERKINRLKWSNNDTLKQLFEMQTRANRLARSLGFNDVYEAQVNIDMADHEIPFKDCFERIESLQSELSSEKAQNERLKGDLKLLEDERDHLKAAADMPGKDHKEVATKYKSINIKLEQLQSRYDELLLVKERAATRYKTDYQRWRKMKDWLFAEDDDGVKAKNEKLMTEVERKKRETARVMKKRKLVKELGLDIPLFDGDDNKDATPVPSSAKVANPEIDKENQPIPPSMESSPYTSLMPSPTMVAPADTSSTSDSHTTPRAGPTALPHPKLKTVFHTAPSSSPTVFLPQTSNTRTPLTFKHIPNTRIKQEMTSPLTHEISRPRKRQCTSRSPVGNSSDTEEDSQAIGLFPAPTEGFKIPEPPSTIRPKISYMTHLPQSKAEPQSQCKSTNPIASSQANTLRHPACTSPDLSPSPLSARRGAILNIPAHPTLPDKPTSPQPDDRRRSDVGVVSRDEDSLQPLKMRRLSEPEFLNKTNIIGSTTPDVTRGPARVGSSSNGKRKGKEKGTGPRAPLSTPTDKVGQKRLEDYSTFKGRGRYAKDVTLGNKSINTAYVIDPDRNRGLDFQYDEVVRRKEDRRQMDAGDCECCRDYYEAVGPLPNRLQAPLWRSPLNTPTKACQRHQSQASGSKNAELESRRQAEINSHRQAISRHRHHWARPNTPPGYWNIGFPDTQEAENINEQAEEMHRKKRAEVEDAVIRGDGRYKKR